MHLKNVKLFGCFAKASLEGSGSGTVLKPFRVDGLQVGLAIASLPGSLRATKAAAKDAKIRTALAKKQAAFLGKVEAQAAQTKAKKANPTGTTAKHDEREVADKHMDFPGMVSSSSNAVAAAEALEHNVNLFECSAKATLESTRSGTVSKTFQVDGLQVGLAIASLGCQPEWLLHGVGCQPGGCRYRSGTLKLFR